MGDLHDISTPSGAFNRCIFRWRHVAWTLLAATAFLVVIVNLVNIASLKVPLTQKAPTPTLLSPKHVPSLRRATPKDVPESTFVVEGSKLMYHGNESKFEDRHFDTFPGLPNVSEPIDEIEIKWIRVEGANLTWALREFYSSLRRLHLDNVTLEGSLEPVELSSLEEFRLMQTVPPEEMSDGPLFSMGLMQKERLWLESTLFFLNDSTSDFPSKAVDAYRKGVNVTIYLRGSLTYELNPKGKEIRLAISNCSEILEELRNEYTSVTLGRCEDLREDSVSSSTTLLNFYIVENVTSDLLAGILRNLPNLEQFVAEIPNKSEVLKVDVSAFGGKIRVISVSSMDIKVPSSGLSLPSVREFYFGSENQYSWLPSRVTTLNDTFFANFPKLFPSVERVGLFDLRDERRYESLAKVMRTPSVTWLLVENFPRIANGNETIPTENELPFVAFVEAELRGAGVKETEETFLLTISGGGAKVGRTLTKEEKLWYRYKYLGWEPIDSWPKYVSVQQKIEEGWLL